MSFSTAPTHRVVQAGFLEWAQPLPLQARAGPRRPATMKIHTAACQTALKDAVSGPSKPTSHDAESPASRQEECTVQSKSQPALVLPPPSAVHRPGPTCPGPMRRCSTPPEDEESPIDLEGENVQPSDAQADDKTAPPSEIMLDDTGEPHLREGLRQTRVHLGDTHPSTLTAMAKLAEELQAQGTVDEARALRRDVIRVQREQIWSRHPPARPMDSAAGAERRFFANVSEHADGERRGSRPIRG